ncbi:MAG: DNA methyltransferase [Rhodopila sp.]|jgi:site-specific DNA-methyltransferase (adenine-specific)
MNKQTVLKLASVNDAALKFHPLADPWPLIKGRRFEALVADIVEKGLQHPIVLYHGKILDGRNRWRACQQSGIALRTTEYVGDDPFGYVVSSNERRELSDSQRSVVAAKIANRPRGGQPLNSSIELFTQEQAAAIEHVSVATVKRAVIVLNSGDVELIEAVEQGDIAVSAAAAQVETRRRRAEMEEKAKLVPEGAERYRLVQQSVTSLMDEPAASVDLIITDPPYPKEYLPLYGDLARGAAHVLKPGGLLLCMSGQSWLPKIFAQLDGPLEYLWTLAYLTPGGQATQVFPRKVNTFWKPVIVYCQGAYVGDWYGDVTRSQVNDNDKDHHHWGQSESGMADLMRRFVMPGQLIMDPFLGGGTTAVVALAMGASFVGFDVDPDALVTTRARLSDVTV